MLDTNQKGFPKDDINPAEKQTKEFALIVSKAIYGQYTTNTSFLNRDSQIRIQMLRSYGDGRQDIRQYMPMILDLEPQVRDNLMSYSVAQIAKLGFMNIKWEIISVAPKFMTLIMQLFEEIEHDIYAEAIDESSIDVKESAKFRIWQQMQNESELGEILKEVGIEAMDKETYRPDSLQELEMLKDNGYFKLATEEAIEKAIRFTLEISRYKEVKRRQIKDFFEIGFAGAKTYYDKQQSKYKVRYCDPENMALSYGTGNTLEDIWYVGEFREMNIADVKEQMPNVSDDDLDALANKYLGRLGNSTDISQYKIFNTAAGTWDYSGMKIWVLDWEYKTIDREFYQQGTSKNGAEMYSPDKYGKIRTGEKRKTQIAKVPMWYKGSWLVDTEFVYDYGKCNDISRPDGYRAESSFKFYKIPGKSKLETIIPFLDLIQLTYLKIQNAIAIAKPAGLAIEVGSLENITVGGKIKDPLEVMAIYSQRGDILWRAAVPKSHQPTATPSKPIEALAGGIGPQLQEHIEIINMSLQNIREYTGLTEPMDATTPNGQQGLGVTKIAMSAATRALGFIYTAYIDVKERIAEDIACKIQAKIIVDDKAYEVMDKAVGSSSTKLLSLGSDVGKTKFNIMVRARATDEQKNFIRTLMTESLKASKNGYSGINEGTAMMIERILQEGNMKFAEMMLSKKIAQAKDEEQKATLQREQFNKEQDQILTAQKHRENMEAVEADIARQTKLIEAKKNADIEINKYLHKNKMEEIAATNQTKVTTAIMDNATKEKIAEESNEASERIAKEKPKTTATTK